MRVRPRALAMMGRGRAGGTASPANEPHLFVPSDVLEVAQGYWWDAANSTGIGGTGFRVIEGNGRTPFDLVQATVASQPTLLTENGGKQFRMRPTTDGNPSSIKTAGSVAAGWTGATYIAGWFRLPVSNGVTTSFGEVFLQHSGGNGFRRTQVPCAQSAAVEVVTFSVSGTGAGASIISAASPMVGSNWVWLECIFDPLFVLGGSLAADRAKIFANLTALTIIQTGGTLPTSLFDASTPLSVGCFTSQGPSDTTDWAACYYANGIPTLANRVKLANYHSPLGALLAA